ncbi:MAG: flagellin FliC [Bdellovibrio sp. CG12_big_fil_rev_8_21_14_0_65_39_13]|nr:MAG: flagellin FliC [Bdellovibrio sp. CG22_combo_CG10-13_8_21_14_all_39_27]PIQ61185.1 MAG: flagellin FliC [Bdellovibrio sp. CG12_big_fil_rev_8_21_14_0_65_39_13]PIR34855.1 MAG: flagellin FliC [Bdellovibrio sp. CG11_big_fil_rev_8_21_14_0_20_39_38]PJB53645.1 MAG: flagellin FliC [Bdellovibrio sp. CG_4_9_14_3_um_filter_39_7]
MRLTNVTSMSAQRILGNNTEDVDRESVRLASGDRIYHAAYDPAGLAISNKLRSRLRSMQQANRNANDSVSMIQVGEGVLSSVHEMGARLKELALQSSNDTMGDSERQMADLEFQNLKIEIKRILGAAKFNGQNLFDELGGKHDFQVGINNDQKADRITYDMKKVLKSADTVGLGNGSIATKGQSHKVLYPIDDMISEVSRARAVLGSMQKRVETVSQGIMIGHENETASESKIRDTEYASSTANLLISKLKQDSTTAWLAQANMESKNIEKLL